MGPVLLNMILFKSLLFCLGSPHYILPHAVAPAGFYGSSFTLHTNKAPWVLTHTLSMSPSSPSKEPLTQQQQPWQFIGVNRCKNNIRCVTYVMWHPLPSKVWKIQIWTQVNTYQWGEKSEKKCFPSSKERLILLAIMIIKSSKNKCFWVVVESMYEPFRHSINSKELNWCAQERKMLW